MKFSEGSKLEWALENILWPMIIGPSSVSLRSNELKCCSPLYANSCLNFLEEVIVHSYLYCVM